MADMHPHLSDVAEGACLSSRSLQRRLLGQDASALIITPLLQKPKGAAIDLRLGNRFIVFHGSSMASFDALEENDDPRSIQSYRELSWTDRFVLHPHEVVLGATLEYLVLPADLSGQVITRSSYGRLGLLSATAVQVHPNFHGCLTLELVNLSTMPIVLTAGERIAQLVLWRTDPDDSIVGEKYSCPIGPQFSKIRDDPDVAVLRKVRGAP
jgi:deoxycytidine triphosphate deaminase